MSNPLRSSRQILPLLAAALLAACAGTGAPRDRVPSPVAAGAPAPIEVPGAAQADAAERPAAPDAAAVVEAFDDAARIAGDATPAEGTPVAGVTGDGMPATGAPTQAELDYAALYGEPVYDPVADPTLPAAAQMPRSYDPWEPFNRKVFAFNSAVDRGVAKPLAKAYAKIVPRPVRLGVSNFFSNLGQPVTALNALLQGRPKDAGQSLGRFVVNSTLGIGGIFDPATDAEIPHRDADFGQTLGVWGWRNSRYVELPLFGPRTLRDGFGMVGDAPLSPLRQLDDDTWRYGLQGLQLVDLRTRLFVVDSMREGATDEYALIRDAWMQRRAYQIESVRRHRGDEDDLPDYLYEDDAMPTVPVDAIPVVPGISNP
ncbi:VacJ family lipoprotein [Luteimonas sp. FCS-9]|uniref:MlaA family lipoprotein n=1 Tax=Luteimonas sp. FCS-9 TaxID=1547516 RepID=UPI00063E8B00|nr:VacJ family lipoprotein [Luteimonas sp. FCS-9]KLI99909.1 lipoprotein [Luteimonas sp. FCS-9]